jgi:glutaredoxin
MNTKTKAFMAIGMLVIFGIYFSNKLTGNVVAGEFDSFAQCLTEKEIKMYGTEWCPHCKDQKGLFGNSFDYVDYIDCDKDRNICTLAGVTGYPTWKINGQNYPGTQQLSRLSELSECEL